MSRAAAKTDFEPAILRLWKEGKDTKAISERLMLPESEVANSLARARDRERVQ